VKIQVRALKFTFGKSGRPPQQLFAPVALTQDNVMLHAVETDTPTGQAILFVHGLSQSFKTQPARQKRKAFRFSLN
jgi:hypothetical protein